MQTTTRHRIAVATTLAHSVQILPSVIIHLLRVAIQLHVTEQALPERCTLPLFHLLRKLPARVARGKTDSTQRNGPAVATFRNAFRRVTDDQCVDRIKIISRPDGTDKIVKGRFNSSPASVQSFAIRPRSDVYCPLVRVKPPLPGDESRGRKRLYPGWSGSGLILATCCLSRWRTAENAR
jgi:hypothetical protein